MASLFNVLIYKPLLNSLIWLYGNVSAGDMGIAIILFTGLVRLILAPLFQKALENQKEMAEIQPEILKIQEKYKDDKEKQSLEIMEVYRKNKINPFASLIILFVQLPVFIAAFNVLNMVLGGDFSSRLYSFVSYPPVINYSFLGLINLQKSSILLLSITAVFQFFQSLLASPQPVDYKKDFSSKEANEAKKKSVMSAFFITIFILWFFRDKPAAIMLYWFVSAAISIIQQIIVNKSSNKNGKLKGDN